MNPSHVGAPQREVYFMGLIDMLTQYDTKKKAAHAAKAVKHGVRGLNGLVGIFCLYMSILWSVKVCFHVYSHIFNRLCLCVFLFMQAGAEISTVHPEQYAKRFREFITKIFA